MYGAVTVLAPHLVICVSDRLTRVKHKALATWIVAPESVGSMTTNVQMNQLSGGESAGHRTVGGTGAAELSVGDLSGMNQLSRGV